MILLPQEFAVCVLSLCIRICLYWICYKYFENYISSICDIRLWAKRPAKNGLNSQVVSWHVQVTYKSNYFEFTKMILCLKRTESQHRFDCTFIVWLVCFRRSGAHSRTVAVNVSPPGSPSWEPATRVNMAGWHTVRRTSDDRYSNSTRFWSNLRKLFLRTSTFNWKFKSKVPYNC